MKRQYHPISLLKHINYNIANKLIMMNHQDVFFVLIVISFLFFALIKGFYWRHAKMFFMSVFAQRYANQYLREDNAFTERVNLLTFLLMSINFTLILAILIPKSVLSSVLEIFLCVVFFFLLKKVIIFLFGILIKEKELAKLLVFFSFLFDKTLGFVLSPIVLLLYFFIFDISAILLTITFCIFLIIGLLKIFWLWNIGKNSFGLSQSYIFLYLCILEIAPFIMLSKGIVY